MTCKGWALLRMTWKGCTPQNDDDWGCPRTVIANPAPSPDVVPKPPIVILNGVRNLGYPSDGWFITATVHWVSRHLRFFVVRSSE